MNSQRVNVLNSRSGRLAAVSLMALAGFLSSSHALADRYRTVVVHETRSSSPSVVYGGSTHSTRVVSSNTPIVYAPVHQAPVYHVPVYYVPGYQVPVYHTQVYHQPVQQSNLYFGPGHHSNYISPVHHSASSTTRTTIRTTTTVRSQGNAHSYRQGSHYGHGHGSHVVRSHPGHRHGHHRNHSQSRGSWSSNRRDVIYVDRKGSRNSSYREAEQRSAVIRDRSR
jgi:hypothetical protein